MTVASVVCGEWPLAQQLLPPLGWVAGDLRPCGLEIRVALPGGEAGSRSLSLSSLGAGSGASRWQVGAIGGWPGAGSPGSSWISGRGALVSPVGVSESLLAAASQMAVKGVSAVLHVSLGMANMFERASEVSSGTGSEEWSSSGSLSSLQLETAVIFGKHIC